METGLVNRLQGLLFLITTASYNFYGPCGRLRRIYIEVLKGLKDNPYLFCIIFTIDEGDEWTDPAVWKKANPNLGNSPYVEALQAAFQSAITEGAAAVVEFKTKHLCQWTRQSEEFISDKAWTESGASFDVEKLKGRRCFSALDLSIVNDLSAAVHIFPPEYDDPNFYVLAFFWCPEDGIEKRSTKDRVPYLDWAESGHIIPTPGNIIDHNWIYEHFIEFRQNHNVVNINYDARYAHHLIYKLESAGFVCNKFLQSPEWYSATIQGEGGIQSLVIKKILCHNNNPVLRWMNGNVVLKRYPRGGLMIDKAKSTERIDGVQALCMAIGGYLREDIEAAASYYENNDLEIL